MKSSRRIILIIIAFGYISCVKGLSKEVNCTSTVNVHEKYCMNVDCSNRNLTAIPSNLPNSTCELDLHGNNISRLLNTSLSQYPNLTSLNMSSNVITDIEEASFMDNGNLKSLDLSNNLLSFVNTTLSVFSPLGGLRYLNLSNNSYSDYPDLIVSPLKALEGLCLDGFMKTLGEGFRNLEKLSYLSLSGSKGKCQIDHLSASIFVNVPNITHLDISYCKIYSVESGALSHLLNIDTLDLSGNRHLGLNGIRNATLGLQNSKLKKLLINQIVGEHTICVMVLRTHIMHLQNSSLEQIDANDNRIEMFNEDVFSLLPKSLKYANVRSSRLTYGAYLWTLWNLTGLISLDLSGRPGVHSVPFADPDDTDNSDEWSFPSVTGCSSWGGEKDGQQYSHHCYNSINRYEAKSIHNNEYNGHERLIQTQQEPFGIPPNLTTFKYTNSILAFALSKIHFAENSLRHIDISYNIFTVWKGPIYGLENVTHLDLSGNIARKVYPDFFANFNSLKVLNISHNFLGSSFYNNAHGRYFRNQHQLKVLDLSLNSIMYLHLDVFVGLKSLQVLNISRNMIFNLSLNFENNVNLSFISCADNSVRWIQPFGRSQMSKLAEKHNFSIDLSHNALRCTCETIDFFDWFLNSKIQPVNLENTYCLNDRDEPQYLRKHPNLVDHLKSSCRSYFGLAMGSMAASVLVFSLMLSAMCYRYRWRLTYWYYVTKLKLKSGKLDTLDYEYDMYVAYADSELDFVCTNMIQMLETQRGHRLYIRDRDSLSGSLIAENIIDEIRKSKITVLLLSKMFLKKKWCRYELHMANMESVSTGRSVMVIVMLEDIPRKDIPSEIHYEIQNGRFLEYPHDDNARDRFWTNMHAIIEA